MRAIACTNCRDTTFEQREIEYLYSHEGKYLLVPDTPVEVCRQCGMVYYDATVLKEIERRFFAIHQGGEKPEHYVRMPQVSFDTMVSS
jgi:YgiT-type zinc finger domain-containing protein